MKNQKIIIDDTEMIYDGEFLSCWRDNQGYLHFCVPYAAFCVYKEEIATIKKDIKKLSKKLDKIK